MKSHFAKAIFSVTVLGVVAGTLWGVCRTGCTALWLGLILIIDPFVDHSPKAACERVPLRAYAEGGQCLDAGGRLNPSPVTTRNVNKKEEGICALEHALAAQNMQLYQEAWAKGADPYLCAPASNFYEFLLSDCNETNNPTDQFIDAANSLGKFAGPRNSHDLLEASVQRMCLHGIEVALKNGATVQSRIAPQGAADERKSVFHVASHRADYFSSRPAELNAFLRLLVAGACPSVAEFEEFVQRPNGSPSASRDEAIGAIRVACPAK